MTTTRSRLPRPKPVDLMHVTPARTRALRLAVEALDRYGDTATAALLRTEFPAAFPELAGPLFDAAPAAPAVAVVHEDPSVRVRPVAFPGCDVLHETHPRVQAVVEVDDAPSRPRLIVEDPKWHLDCLWERWRYRVGEVEYPRWKKQVAGALQLYSFVEMWNAIEAFRETGMRQHGNRLAAWLDALPRYIVAGRMPYRNAFGDLTTRGRVVFGEATAP